ncbi:MAG TPA: hypothetical protein DEA08_23130, partial [Planctomycetes bacterium]|nr:hypothetical protein [Planctomycetota bacterium]
MSEQLEERDLQALLVLARRASSALSGPPGQSLRYRVKLSKPRAGRDRGEWVLRCYGPGLSRYGRREPSGVPFSPETRDDAEAARRSREAALNASSNLTIREVYEEWLEARIASGKLAESTIASYRKPLVWLGRNGWGDLLDGGLTAAELLRLRDLMLEGLKVKSCLWIWGRVREAWRWARRRELVVQAWPELERPRVPNLERPRKRAFTEAEVREVLEHLRGYLGGHYLPAAWLLAETG